MAAGAFVVTVIIGFIVLPSAVGDLVVRRRLLPGEPNRLCRRRGQPVAARILTRLAGSVSGGQAPWYIVAVIVAVVGLAAAALLHQSGRTFAGLMACALTALLVSPISWDHHWVWIAPGLALIIDAAVRAATTAARAGWLALAGVVLVVYARLAGLLVAEGGTAPGRADQLRPEQLLRARGQPGVPRVPLARPAAPRGEPVRARRDRAVPRGGGDSGPAPRYGATC